MCGIGGLLSFVGPNPGAAAALQAMSSALGHRGPDGEGSVIRGPAALFHRRLSIIDVAGGAQPMATDDQSAWITFNGEIYNFRELRAELQGLGHVFRRDSDTEVVLHAYQQWGEQCVQKLRGMFAFGIWDEPRQRLFLARDRVGIKPLVYFQDRERFAFASELQALRAIPGLTLAPDLKAIDLYLHFQYVPAPFTAYSGVFKLPPACTLTVEPDGTVRGPTRYWSLEFRPDTSVSEDEWCRRLDVELRDAVRCHTISDVPFGAFLSGGVDSSTVVAYMSEVLDEPVRTFSMGFAEDAYDETPYARQVAERLGTLHFEDRVAPDRLEVLPKLVRHYGEPFADSSAVATYYVSRLAASQVKMVLSGDGGDENFAGYRSYEAVLRRGLGPRDPVRRARFMAGAVLRAMRLRPQIPAPREAWYSTIAYFDEPARAALWRPEHRAVLGSTRAFMHAQYARTDHRDLCSHLQRLDVDAYLPHDILAKVDIASMMNGLEVRVPLLDHRLMEMVATIPSSLKWRRGTHARPDTGKYIFKKTAQRFFPAELVHRKKQGFEVPIRLWFSGEARPWLRERLLDPNGPLREWFEPAVIERTLAEHGAEQHNHPKLWALLVLREWLDQQAGLSS